MKLIIQSIRRHVTAAKVLLFARSANQCTKCSPKRHTVFNTKTTYRPTLNSNWNLTTSDMRCTINDTRNVTYYIANVTVGSFNNPIRYTIIEWSQIKRAQGNSKVLQGEILCSLVISRAFNVNSHVWPCCVLISTVGNRSVHMFNVSRYKFTSGRKEKGIKK